MRTQVCNYNCVAHLGVLPKGTNIVDAVTKTSQSDLTRTVTGLSRTG